MQLEIAERRSTSTVKAFAAGLMVAALFCVVYYNDSSIDRSVPLSDAGANLDFAQHQRRKATALKHLLIKSSQHHAHIGKAASPAVISQLEDLDPLRREGIPPPSLLDDLGCTLGTRKEILKCTFQRKPNKGFKGRFFTITDEVESVPDLTPHGVHGDAHVEETDIEDVSLHIDYDGDKFAAIGADSTKDHFAVRWKGFMRVRTAGTYTFFLNSDDGSKLYIDEGRVDGILKPTLIIDDDGLHAMGEYDQASGEVDLSSAYHSVLVDYFEKGGEQGITLKYKGPDTNQEVVFVEGYHRAVEVPLPPPPPGPAAAPASANPAPPGPGPFLIEAELATQETSRENAESKWLDEQDVDCGNSALNGFTLNERGLAGPFQKTGKMKTGKTDIGNHKTHYLDRQTVNCGSSPINKFHLRRDGGRIQYAYKCAENGNMEAPQQQVTDWQDDGSGKLIFLDRLNVECDADSLITKFHYDRNSNGNKVTENVHVRKVFAFLYTYIMNLFPPHHHHDCLQMRYEYSCAKSVAPLSCYNTYTSSNDDGGGDEKLEFLDRHNVKCRSDEAMQKFHLQRTQGNKIFYDYRCCKNAEPGMFLHYEYSCGKISPDALVFWSWKGPEHWQDTVSNNALFAPEAAETRAVPYQNGNALLLANLNVDCGTDKVITEFKLRHIRASHKIAYLFKCASSPSPLTCRDVETDETPIANGAVNLLSQLSVRCNDDEALQQFQLSNPSGNNAKYTYKCCYVQSAADNIAAAAAEQAGDT